MVTFKCFVSSLVQFVHATGLGFTRTSKLKLSDPIKLVKTVPISLENKQGTPIYLSRYKLSPMSSSLFSQQNLLPYCQPFCILGGWGEKRKQGGKASNVWRGKKDHLQCCTGFQKMLRAWTLVSSMNVTGDIDSELHQPEGPTPYIHRYIKEG